MSNQARARSIWELRSVAAGEQGHATRSRRPVPCSPSPKPCPGVDKGRVRALGASNAITVASLYLVSSSWSDDGVGLGGRGCSSMACWRVIRFLLWRQFKQDGGYVIVSQLQHVCLALAATLLNGTPALQSWQLRTVPSFMHAPLNDRKSCRVHSPPQACLMLNDVDASVAIPRR